ncbi:MAG: GIY-YIG nuclease family protein [Saprospiraceae bacterium]|nr:GIY-YIG nuclease family protein [Saprospiraceae bacterium]
MDKIYSIIDLETTGGRADRDRVTEIAIIIHDGHKILDRFESLINPERPIPYGITELTGITQEMVQDAPKFFEVAKKVVELTENTIFVAHNVRFDYSFLREEFSRLGFTYSRKTLCTVRLSRQVFPGLPSYSLGNLIRHFNIEVKDRHRAMADTQATAELFEKILAQQDSDIGISDMINLGVRESLLPKNISLERIHALPEACGVYYFHNISGDVVYVGKSRNIKKRVASHFSKKTPKGRLLQQHVEDISYEITGSELVALLYESDEIKRLAPSINRAQRVRRFPFVIYSFEDEEGRIHLDYSRNNKLIREKYNILSEYPKQARAAGHIKSVLLKYGLCPKMCGIEKGSGPCFSYHLKQCQGVCVGHESVADYNVRVLEAMERISTQMNENFFVMDQGRQAEEAAIVLIEKGAYQGFGYIDSQEQISEPDQLREFIKPFQNNPETHRIIRRFLMDNPTVKLIHF